MKAQLFNSPQGNFRNASDCALQSKMDRPSDPRAEFNRLFLKNTTLMAAAHHYNLTAEEMGLALHYARLTKLIGSAQQASPPARVMFKPLAEPAPTHVFCRQCDRRVSLAEGEQCQAPFCKAKS